MKTSEETRALTGAPRQCDGRYAGDAPSALRHARLHRHLDEIDALATGSAEGVLDDFVGAGADPPLVMIRSDLRRTGRAPR